MGELPALCFGALTVFPEARHPRLGDADLILSPREARVLGALASAEGEWIHEDTLLAALPKGSRTPIKVIISSIRGKIRDLSPDAGTLIERGRGGNYRLSMQPIPLDNAAGALQNGQNVLATHGALFDRKRRRLTGPAGHAVLNPGCSALLVKLLEGAPVFIPAEALLETLESALGRPVGRQTLTSYIWRLRDCGGSVGLGRLVESRSKFGYRVAPASAVLRKTSH